jgi:hypothetical protein
LPAAALRVFRLLGPVPGPDLFVEVGAPEDRRAVQTL